jgi:Zn-dependent M28 family amino/carboxypeptidase
MDVLNLYGKTRDLGTVGVDQSSLGTLVRQAAAAERMTINEDPDDLRRGRFFRSDNYAFARADIPAMRLVNGVDFVGRPSDWGGSNASGTGTSATTNPATNWRLG